MYRKILNDPLKFPSEMKEDARNLITRLLSRDPENRLGSNGAGEIKKHPFFKSSTSLFLLFLFPPFPLSLCHKSSGLTPILPLVDWKKLLAKQIQPPFKPNVRSAVDCSNVDEVFTSEDPVDSVVEGSKISQTVQNQFIDFSYTNPNDLGVSPHGVAVS